MNEPYISVVIPTRNRPLNLANCITALERQEEFSFPFEVIIVDDHSEKRAKNAYERIFLNNSRLNLKVSAIPQHQKGAVFARNLV